jgi:hypothetical protein
MGPQPLLFGMLNEMEGDTDARRRLLRLHQGNLKLEQRHRLLPDAPRSGSQVPEQDRAELGRRRNVGQVRGAADHPQPRAGDR